MSGRPFNLKEGLQLWAFLRHAKGVLASFRLFVPPAQSGTLTLLVEIDGITLGFTSASAFLRLHANLSSLQQDFPQSLEP